MINQSRPDLDFREVRSRGAATTEERESLHFSLRESQVAAAARRERESDETRHEVGAVCVTASGVERGMVYVICIRGVRYF